MSHSANLSAPIPVTNSTTFTFEIPHSIFAELSLTLYEDLCEGFSASGFLVDVMDALKNTRIKHPDGSTTLLLPMSDPDEKIPEIGASYNDIMQNRYWFATIVSEEAKAQDIDTEIATLNLANRLITLVMEHTGFDRKYVINLFCQATFSGISHLAIHKIIPEKYSDKIVCHNSAEDLKIVISEDGRNASIITKGADLSLPITKTLATVDSELTFEDNNVRTATMHITNTDPMAKYLCKDSISRQILNDFNRLLTYYLEINGMDQTLNSGIRGYLDSSQTALLKTQLFVCQFKWDLAIKQCKKFLDNNLTLQHNAIEYKILANIFRDYISFLPEGLTSERLTKERIIDIITKTDALSISQPQSDEAGSATAPPTPTSSSDHNSDSDSKLDSGSDCSQGENHSQLVVFAECGLLAPTGSEKDSFKRLLLDKLEKLLAQDDTKLAVDKTLMIRQEIKFISDHTQISPQLSSFAKDQLRKLKDSAEPCSIAVVGMMNPGARIRALQNTPEHLAEKVLKNLIKEIKQYDDELLTKTYSQDLVIFSRSELTASSSQQISKFGIRAGKDGTRPHKATREENLITALRGILDRSNLQEQQEMLINLLNKFANPEPKQKCDATLTTFAREKIEELSKYSNAQTQSDSDITSSELPPQQPLASIINETIDLLESHDSGLIKKSCVLL